jgi:hypothetical protein
MTNTLREGLTPHQPAYIGQGGYADCGCDPVG